MSEARGRLVIVSGPSGVGKTTVVRRVLAECRVPLERSVSATTRPPRVGERDGVDYHFLSPDDFAARRARGEFIECFEVFRRGHWYGTLRGTIDDGLARGRWMLLEIDVQGALEVVRQCPAAITIFLEPGSPEELEKRLRGRGTESEDAVQARLAEARKELELADRYRYRVVNDDVQRAVNEICTILSRHWENGER